MAPLRKAVPWRKYLCISCCYRSSITFSTRKAICPHLEEGHLSSLEGSDFGTFINKSEIEEKRQRSKDEIVDLLSSEGERWAQWVEKLPEALLSEQVRMPGGVTKNRFEMLLGTKEHEMHHRAQLTVSERLLGVVPHLTRRRQVAREEAAS